MSDAEAVLDIPVDMDSEFTNAETTNNPETLIHETPCDPRPSIDTANQEVMLLLKQIRDSQCTKNDLQEYSKSIAMKFEDMDKRVSVNSSAVRSVEVRLSLIEATLVKNNYEAELMKQSALSHNLSIMGIPATAKENLSSIALKVFDKFGCNLSHTEVYGCYRIKNTNMFIAKFNDFAIKQKILKAKVNITLRLSDIISSKLTGPDTTIFVNNHVTPFFGKLLAEGRKAVKENRIHSVWLNRNGCNVRLELNGLERIYRSTDELYNMITAMENQPRGQQPNNRPKRPRPEEDDISQHNMHRPKK